MKIYVAGTMHDDQISSEEIVNALTTAGHHVTSRWLRPGNWLPEARQQGLKARQGIAMTNYADIDAADLVVAVIPKAQAHHLRGMHTEMGYALGCGKPVIVLGSYLDVNTMGNHEKVTYKTSMDDLLAALKEKETRVTLYDPANNAVGMHAPMGDGLYQGQKYMGTYFGMGSAYYVMEDGSVLCDGSPLYGPGYFRRGK